MRRQSTGIVKWFDNDKGAGVIINKSGQEVFVHYRDIKSDGFRTLQAKQRITYTEVRDENGLKALDVLVDSNRRMSIEAYKSPVLGNVARVFALFVLIVFIWYLLS